MDSNCREKAWPEIQIQIIWRYRGEIMKKENNIKKHCAHDMHFDDERGKCVIDSENVESRNKSAPNLRFKKTESV